MNGLYLIKPTSIASTGSGNSSSISANGSVTFSSCATLSLNGVFSADYDNYMIVMRGTCSPNATIWTRFRASGTDASGSNYTQQYLYATSSTVAGGRNTYTYFETSAAWGSTQSGEVISVFGPYLSQPTAVRSIDISGDTTNGARLFDVASTHSLSTAYDGISFLPSSATMTGLIGVYGMVK